MPFETLIKSRDRSTHGWMSENRPIAQVEVALVHSRLSGPCRVDSEATPMFDYTLAEHESLPRGALLDPVTKQCSPFKKFFKDAGKNPPGLRYDFYHPPIPVQIDGSLFFDMSHAKGSRPGPPSLKSRMPVVWEVHPISKMVFK